MLDEVVRSCLPILVAVTVGTVLIFMKVALDLLMRLAPILVPVAIVLTLVFGTYLCTPMTAEQRASIPADRQAENEAIVTPIAQGFLKVVYYTTSGPYVPHCFVIAVVLLVIELLFVFGGA